MTGPNDAASPGTWATSRPALNFAVFVTGASLLVLEIAATRLLSPYYGNTLYTVSSVITVVLGALSIGYAVGGRLADRHPTGAWFYGAIALSGLATLLLRVLALTLLPAVGFGLPLDTGPLIMAPALFFLPSLLLAVLSPYAVKLQSMAHPEVGSGTNAGSVFFWSTLGSIAGSLSAGFYLVPTLGLSRLFLAIGLLLAVLGGVGWIASRPAAASRLMLGLAVLAGLAGLPALKGARSSALVYSHDGVYQRVQVFDAPFADRPSRQLWLDRSASGVMFVDGDDLAYAYTRYWRLADVLCPAVERALVLGAGPFSIPKDLLARKRDVVVDVVDIEPELFPLSVRFFGLRPDPRLFNHVMDARGFLLRTREAYDLIFVDVYYSITIPEHLTTREFFELVRGRLSERGIVVANVVGDLGGKPPTLLGSLVRTFRATFAEPLIIAVGSVDSREQQNFLLVGARHPLALDPADPRLAAHPLSEIRDLPGHLFSPEKLALDRELVFTDDRPAADLLTSRQIDRIPRQGGS